MTLAEMGTGENGAEWKGQEEPAVRVTGAEGSGMVEVRKAGRAKSDWEVCSGCGLHFEKIFCIFLENEDRWRVTLEPTG